MATKGKGDFPHPPPAARAALDALAARDSHLAQIEKRAGPLPWRVRPPGFPGLLQAIVAQQISNQAAAAIWRRVAALPGALEPSGLLGLSEEALRAAGLSRPKVVHARALAISFVEGRLEARALQGMDDEAAIEAIVAIRGMGRWSAEIYLLFALGRSDVFPSGDLALAAAAAHLLSLPTRPSPTALRAIAEAWRPARGLAARLLWHHWRHVTGRPALDDIDASRP
ncbi:MAG TPA: DNA-3-methyladenine glycosylase 2 family protein [Acetobacteraceae bacterium]|nr:DNA-3-methyladenine glycosylase 2 family protein [Acetobacteraceae bacterium]